MSPIGLMGPIRLIGLISLIGLWSLAADAQIRIGGNVYGGGNHAEVKGSTRVTVTAGDIGAVLEGDRPLADPLGKVFGGARMANVGGSTFVNIDGENATGYILINQVFGGNDIAGQIGTPGAVGDTIPAELTEVKRVEGDLTNEKKNTVDNTFNSFVRISSKVWMDEVADTVKKYQQSEIDLASTDPEDPAYGKRVTDVKPDPAAKKIYIGQLFAGGNGDFTYTDENGEPLMEGGLYVIKQGESIIAKSETPFVLPELDKTYLEIKGGSIVYGYGGGNNATVKEQNIIHMDNPSAVVNHIKVDASGVEDEEGTDLLTTERFKEMGINTTFSFPSSGAYQIGRFFGGNNKATMAIRPTWNLLAGKVRNLYSGGNKGSMTSPDGLLLEIKDYSSLIIDNLYGGCRMADVKPTVNGEYVPCMNLPGYNFPNELAARTLVRGGHVNNVYGGNDVTGSVYGGNAVGIYTAVYGDVYGGGNGAYPYTNLLKDDEIYGDFYFERGDYSSVSEALKAFRPNAEQVSIRLKGTDANHKTVIKGSVYVGGNCASLATKKSKPLVELKIGSHVIADKVFLGNNGEKMIDTTLLKLYKDQTDNLPLTDKSVFAGYMNGVAMPLKPNIVFDKVANGDPVDYIDNTSMVGSFYGGGNKGSMIVSGKTTLKFDRKLIIFNKLVGGCNDADVKETALNAAYQGGLLGSEDEQASYTDGDGKIKDRLELSLDNVLVEPRRWNDTFTPVPDGTTLTAGKEYYETNLHHTKFIADGTEVSTTANPYYKLTTVGLDLDWNTAIWSIDEDDFVSTDSTNTANDSKRRLIGGNIYGGCYTSGHVNGNVIININQDVVKRDVVFAQPDPEDEYTMGTPRRSGVLLAEQGEDVQATEMTIFGGGCGKETEIWGSTTINHNNGYAFQMFGGGEEGVIGKKNSSGEYGYNAAYSTTVNLKGINAGYSEEEEGLAIPETEYIYGGGCEGDVTGDSYVYLGNGRVYDVFGGASNANIYGAAEVHIGYNDGFPWIRDNVYGGNDFGGTIMGKINHTRSIAREVFDAQLLQSSTYVKYIQGRVDSIFGGNYGHYDYKDRAFKYYTNDDGSPKAGFNFPHLNENSFVHFVPEDHSKNMVSYVIGGSTGYPGHERLCNSMQKEAYVLLDDTKTTDVNRFAHVDVYGGGAFAGVGETSLGAGRTAVDLFAGSFHNIYGGCNHEGLVGYARVNVPAGSTARVNALFGGGKGYDPALFDVEATRPLAARFCDHYVTCVNFNSKDAIVNDGIYGGNENCRISCDTYINITAPVLQSNGYQATIYGAGYGKKTVSGRTNIFMNNGSNAYKVFGGGRDGNAFNFATLTQWLAAQFTLAGVPAEQVPAKVAAYGTVLNDFGTYLASNPLNLPSNIGTYPNPSTGKYTGDYTNDIITNTKYHQTNVHIMNGGNVSGYAYGGGLGENAVVAGTTYIELKGGNVERDIYGGGQGGPVYDEYGLVKDANPANDFVAATNVYIEGGMARNVYGGGYLGHVGKHTGEISDSDTGDIPAVTNVTIGKTDGTTFYDGIPAIMRNAYGGGEGGSIYGKANLTINNGYIGYRYKNVSKTSVPSYQYVEELDDQTPNAIELAGNAFGGGYVINSFVDSTNVEMYGGTVRGSLYGGGELGPIGRGTMKAGAISGFENGSAHIYKGGVTHVKLYDGHVLRNVFGGGRGKDSWGGDGTKYMDAALIPTLDLKARGYVFGKTEVDVYGGEVGTSDGVAQGYGNVFGAGDVGCVYSATGTKDDGERYDGDKEGYYYDGSDNLTEDCKVLVEPWCKANAAVTISDSTFAIGSFVPTSYLNYLGNKTASATEWGKLSKTDPNKEGVIIHNAVFAGGNTSPGSTEVFANTNTVFGNATASIHDVYNRDLISIGRGRVGGLYGDGNLTLVDGYRELNITNYGTDYYHINPEITLEQYNALPLREEAYYEIRYKCLKQCTDKDGKTYAEKSTITADEMLTVFDGVKVKVDAVADSVLMLDSDGKPRPEYWEENGVCSRYAGRPMNTIQRADFCGVFGSRMVMQGAQDRVPETVDYTNYTINRVREVSLNKKTSVRPGDAGDEKNKEHGNYFGIYSVVNYLGALTSDVDFHSVRTTDNAEYKTPTDTYTDPSGSVASKPYGTATYYDWKAGFNEERKRNNGTSHNKVALASGVYLELTSEKSTGKGLYEKDWGLITGVVELDLINVQPGTGGGYVYAKNEHGQRSDSGNNQTILTELNKNTATSERAVTNKIYKYTTADNTKTAWETSGNFIHSTKTIIDDCYNIGDRYTGAGAMPAHYWYIRGAVYVYDQYISAYTGSSNAFSEEISIPLTVTTASHGKMKLLNVQPNRYAYYSNGNTKTKIKDGQTITIRDVEYGLNDVISYWDYSQLTAHERAMFVDSTYVVITDCKIGNDTIYEGTVYLPSEYNDLKTDNDSVYHIGQEKNVAFDYAFRKSNNASHNTGYILTYNVDNPDLWNTWYSKADGSEAKNQTGGSGFEDGPTYTPNTTGMYGQSDYKVGSIISKEEFTTYNTAYARLSTDEKTALGTQAEFYPAYMVKDDLLETKNKNNVDQRLHKGATLAEDEYTDAQWSSISSSVDSAFVVTNTIQLSNTDIVYRNTCISKTEKTRLLTSYPSFAAEINKYVVPAYYCTVEGKYGGNYYVANNNYRALSAFTAMSPEDRAKFAFNYDALDLLIDPTYSRNEGEKYQYDSAEGTYDGADANPAHYSLPTSIDYTATYKGAGLTLSENVSVKRGNSKITTNELIENDTLTNEVFETLPNEQYYWAPITIEAPGTYYVVKEVIILGDTPYAAGQVISSDTYSGLNASDKEKVVTLNFTAAGDYYYCRKGYTVNPANYEGTSKTGAVTPVGSETALTSTVPEGTVIKAATDGTIYGYDNVINKQTDFSFHGKSPTETTTLYVTRNSDIFDLSKEKIITVVYQYDYVESDMAGLHITPVSERHILNIHLNFKSGIPTVEDIRQPDIILPGTALSMPEPYVTPGAYEITGGGWKLFDTENDAERHVNGVEYTNSVDPLYLYQNKYYLAYYTKTYMGETYSNHVPVSVANYHDLKRVMADTDHHYYIDHKDIYKRLKVEPKIYINDYSEDAEGSKNGLDLFKDIYDLSLVSGSGDGYTVADYKITGAVAPANTNLVGHALLNDSVRAGKHLEFFLRTDIAHPATWTPIGDDGDGKCFKGTLHGDGHTISGLDHSLFNNLCGNVYNLGVTGSFNTAGVADKGPGYVESAWTNTTGTPDGTVRAIFGTPNADSDIKQIVNSYYQSGKNYSTTDGGNHGLAKAMSAKEFYNGTVAYNLNNFYLHKRYANTKGTVNESIKEARYYIIGSNDTLQLQPYRDYADRPDLCSSGYIHNNDTIRYVEERYADGDFRFAGGTIPDEADERMYEDPDDKTKVSFHAIWPDDYIFFGQKLTYGWAIENHDSLPTAVAKSEGRISYGDDANRVYRAPAYYRNATLDVAHFNPHAYLAQTKKNVPATKAYPDMTAIDFKGHKDLAWTLGTTASALPGDRDAFYAPLLDDDGLRSIINCDETQNILVYSPAASVNAKTYGVLGNYFKEPIYTEHYDDPTGYRTVREAAVATVHGHLVQYDKKEAKAIATNDHLLVDKQDFNAPIAYEFDDDHLMWYQRIPADEEYVDLIKGWQGISIPFTAELVTTNQKGEITHFYGGSDESNKGTKKGHEYWLREFKDGGVVDDKGTLSTDDDVYKAVFNYPSTVGNTKTVTNKFLWDYYYWNESVHNQKDANNDTYLQYKQYYNEPREHKGYSYLTAATPYILGLPGETYYEFDLSGKFEAENTATAISKLDKQIITFVSNKGTNIAVSDSEINTAATTFTFGGYAFKPSYLNENLEAGTNNWALNATGSSFDKVPATGDVTPVIAFRPYFTVPAAVSTPARSMTRAYAKRIVFSGSDNDLREGPETVLDGSLEIFTRGYNIVTRSHMKEAVAIRIVTAAGATFSDFVLQPGETIETTVPNTGVYVVNKKKVFVE